MHTGKQTTLANKILQLNNINEFIDLIKTPTITMLDAAEVPNLLG